MAKKDDQKSPGAEGADEEAKVEQEAAESKQAEAEAAAEEKPKPKRKPAAKKTDPTDELWTPDKEKPEGEAGKLWTPGS